MIVAASAWAGISRINWLPVPAMIAISIFLLEMPQCGARGLVDYLRRPFWWGIAGGLSAFASNWLYKRFSGNDPSIFNTSFTSDLLWYRLLPNATFPPGILLSSLIVLLPLALVLAGVLWGRRLSLLRKAGIAAMLLVLLGGGIVVSTKIGGGSNLHNIDAFLVLLLVCASWAAFNRAVPEVSAAPLRVHLVVVLLAVMVPIFTLFQNIYPFPVKSPTARLDAQSDTAEIAARVKAATDGGGRVLFIWQRQLMTFGQVSGVPMEPRYETVDLMEMAMSDNEAYLNQFYEDLREHRFALIIADNQRIVFKSLDESFSEENNVWVERVLLPLLDSYRAEKTLPYSGTRFMVPK